MSFSKPAVTANFLRAMADAVDGLSEKELVTLLNGVGLSRLVANPRATKLKSSPSLMDKQKVEQEAEKLLADLSLCDSRAEAFDKVSQASPTKRVLLEAARRLDLYTDKSDRNGDIIDRLIAHTIGSRLDMAAIRGRDTAPE